MTTTPPEQMPAPKTANAVQESSDDSLLRQFRRGSEDAATQLYKRYACRLHALAQARCSRALAQRVDADDIVQSVFRRFYARVGEGDYVVSDGEDLWKLLMVITMNRIRSAEQYHRAAKRDVTITSGGASLDRLAQAKGQGGDADWTEIEIAVSDALEQLPVHHRHVVQLRLTGMSVVEIAHALGRSLRTVERLLQECRTKLESFFDDSI